MPSLPPNDYPKEMGIILKAVDDIRHALLAMGVREDDQPIAEVVLTPEAYHLLRYHAHYYCSAYGEPLTQSQDQDTKSVINNILFRPTDDSEFFTDYYFVYDEDLENHIIAPKIGGYFRGHKIVGIGPRDAVGEQRQITVMRRRNTRDNAIPYPEPVSNEVPYAAPTRSSRSRNTTANGGAIIGRRVEWDAAAALDAIDTVAVRRALDGIDAAIPDRQYYNYRDLYLSAVTSNTTDDAAEAPAVDGQQNQTTGPTAP